MGPKESFEVDPLRDSIVGGVQVNLSSFSSGAVSLVLLIACANVANLLLDPRLWPQARVAIRVAMGATVAASSASFWWKSILLALTGSITKLSFAGCLIVRSLLALSPGDIPRIGEHGASRHSRLARPPLHHRRLPADWHSRSDSSPPSAPSRPDLNSTLKESSNRSGTGFRQSKSPFPARHQRSLARSRASPSGAALLIRTFLALRHVDPGFNPHNVLTMEMSLTGDRFQKTLGDRSVPVQDGRRAVSKAIQSRSRGLHLLPAGLRAASACPSTSSAVRSVKNPTPAEQSWMDTSPGYFARLQNSHPLGSRDFKDSDVAGAPGVVLINDSMAKKFWPKENPVGQGNPSIGKGVGPQFEEPARQIIGIVEDIRDEWPQPRSRARS